LQILSIFLHNTHIPQRNASGNLGNIMKINDTTRTFPRTLEEAFPNNVQDQQRLQQGEWMETHTFDYEKWLNIVYAFAAGFIVAMLAFGA
jgi:hypothetical protein